MNIPILSPGNRIRQPRNLNNIRLFPSPKKRLNSFQAYQEFCFTGACNDGQKLRTCYRRVRVCPPSEPGPANSYASRLVDNCYWEYIPTRSSLIPCVSVTDDIVAFPDNAEGTRCLGYDFCNQLIADCIGGGGDFGCELYNKWGGCVQGGCSQDVPINPPIS
ncbi:MAG: hypothetical protein AAFZ15_12830 [Bacteroidota bacterium]